jgi:hypothetical protein
MSIIDPSHKILSAMVHKHTESPTLSCTSSACSEEELKPQTHRLGRVIVEDDDDDDDEQQVPISHRREEARDEPVVVSEKEQELFAAIETLNQLAGMDSSDYQARLVDNRLPSFQSHQQQQRQQQQPHLLKLSQSIHRFHSLVNNLCAENDQQTTELLELHRTVDASQQRIDKLEMAVSKLHSRNVKLKKQSQSDKSVAGKLLEQVQTFRTNAARRNEEEEFFKLAQKVQQHEQVMMHTTTTAASASTTSSSSMRERCDSNFSDLDQGLFQDFDGNKSVGSSTTEISSTKSMKSLVTDDGVATVRITRERVFTWPSNSKNDTTDPSDVPKSSSDDEAAVSVSPKPVVAESNHSNPFAMMFLSPKPAQRYTMSFSVPFSMQFVPLEVTVDQQPFAFDKSASASVSAPDGMEPPSIAETAFAVCGYYGFDFALNAKPTLGARLLEINKEEVCPSWSVEELLAQLEAQGKKSSKTTLTFRNDNWNREQKAALHFAVQEQERLHHPATATAQNKRTQSGDKPNLLGFLNFNHHGAGTTTSSSPKEEEAEVVVSPQDQPETPKSMTDATPPGTTTTATTTSPKDERVSPLNNIMLSFWKMKTPSPKNNQQQKSQEGVLFEDVDEEGLALPLPFSDETVSSSDVMVDVEEDADEGDEGDDGVKISESNSDEGDAGEQEEATPKSRNCSDAPNKPSSHNKQAADKFKSSMKNMGKLFAFR